MEVAFYDSVDDAALRFAVVVSRHRGKWVFCRHRERSTYECPGGHREPGEAIVDTAHRELWEETGAVKYVLRPVCVYAVCDYNGSTQNDAETFGMLYFAEIEVLGPLPPLEIVEVALFESAPPMWTYPQIQPRLLEKAIEASDAEENLFGGWG